MAPRGYQRSAEGGETERPKRRHTPSSHPRAARRAPWALARSALGAGIFATAQLGSFASCADADSAAGAAGAASGGLGGAISTAGGGTGATSTAGAGGTGAAGGSTATGGTSAGGGGFAPWQAVVVTFNTGTSLDLDHDADPTDGYGSAEAEVSDEWYGNGLAWLPAVEATTAWFDGLRPDLVVFQEIFHPAQCPSIPSEHHPGYVCESWTPGDPTVVQMVLGPDYQVACNLGKPDKCAAVRSGFGSFAGCNEPLCLDGLAGAQVDGCGSGSRIGRAVVELVAGGTLTLVGVHGSSGMTLDDQLCRVAQIEQVFLDLDGEPAASGQRNLVMGDFNTDPGRNTMFDLSARRWNDFADDDEPFHFVSDVGSSAAPTYAGLFNIDHVVSDAFDGGCWAAGVSAGHPDVYGHVYFDHKPIVCTVAEPE